MSGLTLERPEFLALMNATQAGLVVGLNTRALVPPDRTQHQAMVRQGLDSLLQRGLLRLKGDVHVLNTALFGMATIVAHPQWAVVTTRDNPGVGPQMFVHYVARNVIVEQTFPAAEQHRLALVPNVARLTERVVEILPVNSALNPPASVSLSQAQFFEAKSQIETGHLAEGQAVLRSNGLSEAAAQSLAQALVKPVFGGSIAVMACQKNSVTDARNVAVVQGAESAWVMRQTEPGKAMLTLTSGSAEVLNHLLATWLGELLAA
jgi:hypothetical protein